MTDAALPSGADISVTPGLPAAPATPRRGWLVEAVASLTTRRLLVLIVLLSIGSFQMFAATDIDFWWHYKTGELIATTGIVPHADPFTYSAAGRPWVAHEWLWDLAVYWIYQFGGYALADILSAAIVVSAFAVYYRYLRWVGANEFVAALLTTLTALFAKPSVGVRPRELTFLFLAIFLFCLARHRVGARSPLWLLPILMLVWVNSHGLFVLGLALLGAYGGVALLEWRLARRPFPRVLVITGVACVLAACVNPWGPAMLVYPFGYYFGAENVSFSQVTEFASPDFHERFYQLFALMLLALVALPPRRTGDPIAGARVLTNAGPRPTGRWDVVELLLVITFAFQALVSVRQVPVAAMVIAPVLVARMRDRHRLFGELRPILPRPRFGLLNLAILAVVLAGAAAYVSGSSDLRSRLQLGATPQTADLPVAGVRYIQDHGLPDPVLNYQPWGGYLTFVWYPERRVFIDGRVDMYAPKQIDDYSAIFMLKPTWRQELDDYGFRTVLAQKDSPLVLMLIESGSWERVFQGEHEDVLVRKRSD